jgi:hypothetical protein
MRFKATYETTVTVTGIPEMAGWYHGKEYVEKHLKRHKAKVDNRQGKNQKTLSGLVITFPTSLDTDTFYKMRELVEKLIHEAAEHVKNMEEASKAKDRAYIDAFNFRALSKQNPDAVLRRHREVVARELEYLKAIHDTIVGQEGWAEQTKDRAGGIYDKNDGPADVLSLHAGALIDLQAGYDVWDAFLKHGWKKAGETAQNQDTAVRELFIPFFELLDEDGRDDF